VRWQSWRHRRRRARERPESPICPCSEQIVRDCRKRSAAKHFSSTRTRTRAWTKISVGFSGRIRMTVVDRTGAAAGAVGIKEANMHTAIPSLGFAKAPWRERLICRFCTTLQGG